MVGFGLLCLAVAPLAVAEGNLVVVLALVPFGAMLLGMGLLRPPAKGTAEGICYVERPVRGTAFTIARRTAWMLALVLVGFTLVGIAILAAGQTVIGVLCVAFFGGIGATKIPATLRGESHPILTPDGIHQHRTFVPWDAIEGWSVREHRGTEILALEVDRSQVSTTRGSGRSSASTASSAARSASHCHISPPTASSSSAS